jgi:hypothetical protein
MIVFGGRGAGKHFAYEVDDGITARAKLTDDLKFGSKFSAVCLLGRLVGDETKKFSLKRDSLANNVAGREDIFNVRRDG